MFGFIKRVFAFITLVLLLSFGYQQVADKTPPSLGQNIEVNWLNGSGSYSINYYCTGNSNPETLLFVHGKAGSYVQFLRKNCSFYSKA